MLDYIDVPKIVLFFLIYNHSCCSWSTHWFRVEIKIPESWVEHEVYFLWNSGSEAMIWNDGQPVQVGIFMIMLQQKYSHFLTF